MSTKRESFRPVSVLTRSVRTRGVRDNTMHLHDVIDSLGRYLKKKKLHKHKAEERAMKDAQAAKDAERAVKAEFEAQVRGGQAMLGA